MKVILLLRPFFYYVWQLQPAKIDMDDRQGSSQDIFDRCDMMKVLLFCCFVVVEVIQLLLVPIGIPLVIFSSHG